MKHKFFLITIIFLSLSNNLFANSTTVFISDLQLTIEKQKAVLSGLESDTNADYSIVALNYLELGRNYFKLTEYSIALDFYIKGLEILTENKMLNSNLAGDFFISFSSIYCEIGNYTDSLSMAKKALETYSSDNLFSTDNYKIPICYNLMAKANGALGNYKESIQNAEKAILINSDDDETKIASYHIKGHYLCFMALFDDGIEILEKALSLKKGIEDLQTAEIYASLANANRNVGELYKSLDCCGKELEIYEKYYGSENVKIADAYRNFGTAYIELGDYERAISYIEKAKEVYLSCGINTGDSLSACYTNLGCAYSDVGNNEKALESLNEALKIDIKQYGEIHSSVATVYNNIASVYADEDLEKAIYYQQKTVEIDTKIFGEKSAKCLIDYLNLAVFYEYNGDFENTEKTYLISLEISEKVLGITNPYTAMIYMRLGHFYIAQQNTSKAYDYYEKGIKGYKSCFVSYEDVLGNVWQFLDSTIGFDYITPPPQSLISEMFSVAFEKIEQAMLDNSDNKLDILQYALPLYYYGVMFEISQGNFDKAFEYSECLRARSFLEQIGNEAAMKLDGLSEMDKATIMHFQKQIAECKNQIEFLYSQTESERDNKLLFRAIKELDNATNELKKLDLKIAEKIPSYHELKNPKKASAKKAKNWCGKNRAVLEYVMYEGDENNQNQFAYCFVITNKKIVAVPLDSSYDYNTAINSLLNAITHRPIKSEVTFEKQRNELYEKLVHPVLPYIKGVKDVLIVPDGNLAFLPFDMLRENVDSSDFGKKYAIGISPSVSVSMIADKVKSKSSDALLFGGAWYDKSLSEEEHNHTLRGNGKRGYDRSFATVDNQTRLSVEDLQNILKNEGSAKYFEQKKLNWRDLPGTVVELETLQKTTFTKATVKTQKSASEATLKSMSKDGLLSNYSVLHFACHGYFDSDLSEMSSVLFSEVSGKLFESSDDGYLTIGEASSLNLNAQMVCLSACQTGLGEIKKGEGMVGLSRAFMVAGSKNVGVTLWCVDDEATAEFMTRMYKKVKSGMSYTEAYRRVKNEFRSSDEYCHPYYWAAFVVYE